MRLSTMLRKCETFDQFADAAEAMVIADGDVNRANLAWDYIDWGCDLVFVERRVGKFSSERPAMSQVWSEVVRHAAELAERDEWRERQRASRARKRGHVITRDCWCGPEVVEVVA